MPMRWPAFLAWVIPVIASFAVLFIKIVLDRRAMRPKVRVFLSLDPGLRSQLLVDNSKGQTALYLSAKLHNHGLTSATLTDCTILAKKSRLRKSRFLNAWEEPLYSEVTRILRFTPMNPFKPGVLASVQKDLHSQFLGLLNERLIAGHAYTILLKLQGERLRCPWEKFSVRCEEPSVNPIDTLLIM
jgi:hypothetical protein